MTKHIQSGVILLTVLTLAGCLWLNSPFPRPVLLEKVVPHIWSFLYWTGILIAINALVRTHRRAYWCFILYYALSFITWSAAYFVNGLTTNQFANNSSNPIEITQQVKSEGIIDGSNNRSEMPHTTPNYFVFSLQIGQILLFNGFWLIAKRDIEHAPPAGRGEAPRP